MSNMRIVPMENNGVSYEFDSYDMYMEDYKVWKEQNSDYIRTHGIVAGPRSESWYGCPDGWHGTVSRIDRGWPELRKNLEDMMNGIELDLPVFPSMTTARRRKRARDDHGDSLDMSRVWNGQLDKAWERPVRTERMQPNTKRITLGFDVADNASVSNNEAMWRAALSLLLCDSLAKAGRTFEVWAFDSTANPFVYVGGYERPPSMLWTGMCVKKTNDPLVLDRMCSMLSIGFLRTACFAMQSMGPHTPTPGLGQAMHRGLPATLHARQRDGEVVLRIARCYSKSDAIAEYERAWKEVEAKIADAT